MGLLRGSPVIYCGSPVVRNNVRKEKVWEYPHVYQSRSASREAKDYCAWVFMTLLNLLKNGGGSITDSSYRFLDELWLELLAIHAQKMDIQRKLMQLEAFLWNYPIWISLSLLHINRNHPTLDPENQRKPPLLSGSSLLLLDFSQLPPFFQSCFPFLLPSQKARRRPQAPSPSLFF
ncbi:hypothetical protein VNO77_08319 [Canavalia gladiata]|uniref:Uncharacterized protein n=1 Tax=Canavalia gladiata TaxID=3824 RepID=A0AAN9M8G5_CANGL